MNKRLFIASLLILINLTLFGAYGTTPRARIRIANLELAEPVTLDTLDQMQQIYASQPTNDRKAQYVNYILDNTENNITVEQKIEQVKNIAQIIGNDLSLHSGWLYNTDQDQVDWLQTQKTKIAQKLSQLQWQATSWGMKVLYSTVWWSTIYLGVILAAYLAQDQMQQLNPKYEQKAYGDLAWMPIETVLNLSQSAIIVAKDAITGETTQKNVTMAVGMAVAAAKTAGEFGSQAIETIGRKGADRAQKDLHALANQVAESTEPTPPSWSEVLFGKGNGTGPKENKATAPQKNKAATPQKENKVAAPKTDKSAGSKASSPQLSVTEIHKRKSDLAQAKPAKEEAVKEVTLKSIGNEVIDWLNKRNVKSIDTYVEDEFNKIEQQNAVNEVKLEQLTNKLQKDLAEENQRLQYLDKADRDAKIKNMAIEKSMELKREKDRMDLDIQHRATDLELYKQKELNRVLRDKYIENAPTKKSQSNSSGSNLSNIDPMPDM